MWWWESRQPGCIHWKTHKRMMPKWANCWCSSGIFFRKCIGRKIVYHVFVSDFSYWKTDEHWKDLVLLYIHRNYLKGQRSHMIVFSKLFSKLKFLLDSCSSFPRTFHSKRVFLGFPCRSFDSNRAPFQWGGDRLDPQQLAEDAKGGDHCLVSHLI